MLVFFIIEFILLFLLDMVILILDEMISCLFVKIKGFVNLFKMFCVVILSFVFDILICNIVNLFLLSLKVVVFNGSVVFRCLVVVFSIRFLILCFNLLLIFLNLFRLRKIRFIFLLLWRVFFSVKSKCLLNILWFVSFVSGL